MQKNDRILALLRIIQDQKNSLSIHDILSNLEEKVAKRTIRRWLDELAKMGLIQKIGHKKGMRYQAAHNTTLAVEKHPAKSLLFSDASIQSVSHVKQPLYLREPATYHTDWIEAYKPNETFYLTPAHQELLRGLGERRHNHDLAGTYARHIFNRLLIDLSYNSSRLEGNTYSLLETEKLVLEGNLPANKLNEEAVMILNHKEAIRYLVENVGKIQIEPQVVFTVHYLLADGLLPADACGLVRTHGVKVGGSVYVPLADKRKLEQYLSLACKKAALIQNPYEQSFFFISAYCLFAGI